jgi:hypothetical protein
MVINLEPDLEAALKEHASKLGMAPEVLATNILRKRFLPSTDLEPRDEWERGLLAAAQECGVSLSNEALSREEMYD